MGGEIHITQKGTDWVLEELRKHNIDPAVFTKLASQIREILAEYREDPLGTIIKAVKEEEFGPASKVVEQLLKELGLE